MENLTLKFIPQTKAYFEDSKSKTVDLVRISLRGAIGVLWRRFNCLEELTVKSLYSEV